MLLKKYSDKFLLITIFILNLGCSFSPGMSPSSIEQGKLFDKLDLTFYNIENINFDELPRQEEKYSINTENLNNLIQNNEYRYLLGSGDIIEIKTPDIDELNSDYTIDSEGMINIPYAGNVLIRDFTKNEAEIYIAEILKEYYQDPILSINIKEYKSRYAYITGEISKPQSILLTEKQVSLVDAILDSGYLKDQKTDDKKALLKRDNIIYSIDLFKLFNEINTDLNIYLREEDILHIQRKNEDVIYVFGETGQGVYPLYQNPNLTVLLSNSKINQVTANTSKIYVIRENLKTPLTGSIYKLDASNPSALIYANNFNLISGDVIFVSPSEIVRWNRVISLITPQSGIFTTYDDIDNVVNPTP